jgi:hypothetical protein
VKGSVISLGCFSEDHLVERQIRDRFAKPRVLLLQLLHPFDLVRLKPPELFAPPVVGQLRHADLADRISHRRTLRRQDVHLPQLRDDLFRLVSLAYIQSSSEENPYFESDHFNGGGSAAAQLSQQ